MEVTWYPKRIVIAVGLLFACAALLDTAIAFNRGAAVGVLGLLAYLCVDVGLTFPSAWRRHYRVKP